MIRSNRRVAALLVMGAAVVPLLVAPVRAARSSKPKEIVVVGSKINEIVEGAGFRVGPGFVEAVNDEVFDELREAVHRGIANQRDVLAPHDLSCFAEATELEPVVRRDRIVALLGRRGFEVDGEFLAALSDRVRLLLAQALVRAHANARQVTLVQDL